MTALNKQALREAAVNAKIAGEAPIMPFDQRITALNDFMKVFTPATALVLLGELEAAKQDSARWLKAFEKAVSVGARHEERIAELEESHAQVIQSRDHYKHMTEEGLKQLAESRTVTVKLTDISEYLADVHDKTLAIAFRRLAEGVREGDVAAMRAAGIGVKGE